MWELDHKEGWAPKNWCFQIVVLEKSLESPLDLREIQPINPKGNQFCLFIRMTDARLEAPIFWPKAGGQGENRGWDGWMASQFQWPRIWANSGKCWGTGRLVSCSPWGCKELHGIFQARILEWVAISFSRGIFLTQGLNLGLLHCRWMLYYLSS